MWIVQLVNVLLVLLLILISSSSLSGLLNFSEPPPPQIVRADSYKCGRAIKLQWKRPLLIESKVNGYQVTLRSVNGKSKHISNFSGEVFSHEFDGLEINAVYELSVRARDSNGFGLWAREQLKTAAGKIEMKPLKISLPRHVHLLKAIVCVIWYLIKVSLTEIAVGTRCNLAMKHLQQ